MSKLLRGVVLLVFVLSVVPGVFALSSNIRDSYQPGETMIIEIGGVILEPISKSQVEFKRGHVLVPFDFDVKKIGGKWFIWAIAHMNPEDYTLTINDVSTIVGGKTEVVDLEESFSVKGEMIDYSVKPGFVFSASDFSLRVQLNGDFGRMIDVSFLGQSQRSLSPGQNNLFFDISDVDGIQFMTIGVGRYNVPAYILGESNEEGEPQSCEEKWSCASWGSCSNGKQSRSCVDGNSCGTEDLKPFVERGCVETCEEKWSCASWGSCSNGKQSRSCVDGNSCGSVVNKPLTRQSCSVGGCNEDWLCNNWGACLNSKQNRSCVDGNSCGSVVNKPFVERGCVETCEEKWSCSAWGSCSNGQQSRSCVDGNSCGTEELMPILERGCLECSKNSDCSEKGKEYCRLDINSCVECLVISHCAEGKFCSINTNVCVVKPEDSITTGVVVPQSLINLELRPSRIDSTVLSGEFVVYPLFFVNKGSDKLDLEFEFDEDLFSFYPEIEEGMVALGAGNIGEFFLTLKGDLDEDINESVRIKAGNDSIELPILIRVTEDAGEVSTSYVEQSFVKSSGYYCRELSGVSCGAGEECSIDEVSSLDGSCCTGICEEPSSGGGLAWLGWLIGGIVLIILLIVGVRYMKTRGKKGNLDKGIKGGKGVVPPELGRA